MYIMHNLGIISKAYIYDQRNMQFSRFVLRYLHINS